MLDDAYQAALRGGLSAAMPKDTTKTMATKQQSKPPIEESAGVIGSTSTEGKSKTEKEKVYSLPPGVKTWIEANQSATKWEEEAGETMTNAMYGGGIASMMAAKKKAESKAKKNDVAEEDIIPKSIKNGSTRMMWRYQHNPRMAAGTSR